MQKANKHKFNSFLQNIGSYKLSDLKVVVGQVSLIAIDPGEEYFDVISNHIHESYEAATKRNNIAMLQVMNQIKIN